MKRKSKPVKRTLVEKFSLVSFNHIKTSICFWLALAMFGFFAYTNFLQRQGFPQIEVPISVVSSVYFVGDKAKVDKEVTQPLLDVVTKQSFVKSSRATSYDNVATIVIEFTDGNTSASGTQKLKDAIKNTNTTLPVDAKVEYREINAGKLVNEYDVILSMSSGERTTEDLYAAAQQFADELKSSLPDIQSSTAVDPFTEGINPITKQAETKQATYDWIGQEVNGEFKTLPSVTIGIKLNSNADIIAFDDLLKTKIDELDNKYADQKIAITEAAGFAESVKLQINSLQKNLVEGLIIVILVSLIFIGIRASIIAALAMLVTLAISLGVLYFVGLTLNTITLFGLVLCLGLIVDDIVIMIEAIDTQARRHSTLTESISTAARRVARASMAGTITTVLGFAPLLFFGGILGKFIRTLPITIIISLLVSLFVSLTFVPFLSRWLSGERRIWKFSPLEWFRWLITKLASSVAGLIRGANTPRKKSFRAAIAIGVSISFLLMTAPIFQTIKFDIFPATKDTNDVQLGFFFEPSVTIEQAKLITFKANTITQQTLGENLQKITYYGIANERQATAAITLIPYEDREVTAPQLVAKLQEALKDTDGATITVDRISAGPPKERLPFKAQVASENPEQANAVASKLAAYLNGHEINKSTAKVTEVEYFGEQSALTRIDGKRIVEVSAGFNDDDTTALVQKTQSDVETNFLNNPDNLSGLDKSAVAFDFGNETDNQESFKTVFLAFPILLIIMYVLLALQFRSLLQPFLILIAVPFSFFGVAVGLALSDNPFSFFVMVGFFALIGISVNNTILLTDYANQSRRAGATPREAMANAIEERTRPLLTTSTTTVLALIPLAISDPFWESLAVTLIGGLLASTILVVIAFPYYYLALEYIRTSVRTKLRRKKRR